MSVHVKESEDEVSPNAPHDHATETDGLALPCRSPSIGVIPTLCVAMSVPAPMAIRYKQVEMPKPVNTGDGVTHTTVARSDLSPQRHRSHIRLCTPIS